MTAGLLGIFLGGLGIHNFYLGYTGKAMLKLHYRSVSVQELFGDLLKEL